MKKFTLILVIMLLAGGFTALAQEDKTPEQKEKEFYEAIEKEVERYRDQLDLDIAQEFYVDSIYVAMRKVLNDEQWAKYEKAGAARDKKARDKRAAKKLKKK